MVRLRKAFLAREIRMVRLRKAFLEMKRKAQKVVPWLSGLRLVHCKAADDYHRQEWRLFMHSCCPSKPPLVICHAAGAESELTAKEMRGMIAHEIGHVVGDILGFPRHRSRPSSGMTPPAVQAEANRIALKIFRRKIRYNKRTLQELA